MAERRKSPSLGWLVAIAVAEVCLLRASADNHPPPWDFDALPLLAGLATLAGLFTACRWIQAAGRRERALGVALAIVTLITNPLSSARVNDLLRPGGPVTIDNWREHRELHAIAAMADRIDAGESLKPGRTLHFRCDGEAFVRFKTIRTDDHGRVRYFATSSSRDPAQPVAWYYDEAGALRFVWDHAANHHTFLDARAEPLWAWRREPGAEGEFGLAVVDPADVTQRTASDAQTRFDGGEPGCTAVR